MDEAATAAWYAGVATDDCRIEDERAAGAARRGSRPWPRRRRKVLRLRKGRRHPSQRRSSRPPLKSNPPTKAVACPATKRQWPPVQPARAGSFSSRGTISTIPTGPIRYTSDDEGKEFVERTFIESLEKGTVELPDGPNGAMVEVPISKLGVQYPVVITSNPIIDVAFYPEEVENGTNQSPYSRGAEFGDMSGTEPQGPKIWKLRRYDFTIQFYWTPTPRSARQEKPAAAEGEPTVSVGDGVGPTG